jgi:hypothetical protein
MADVSRLKHAASRAAARVEGLSSRGSTALPLFAGDRAAFSR